MIEFKHYQPRPGHPDLQALAANAAELAEQIRPTLDAPRAGWSERRRRIRGQMQAARNYVRNRRLDRRGREDLRPLYFIWTMLRTCNFDCTYCDDHTGRKYPDLPNDGVLSTEDSHRLLRIMRTGTSAVYFAGGEPTLRKDLPELSRAARDLDYYPITINTNGSTIDRLLKKPSWSTWLADTDIVIVSLDALDVGMLNEMWVYKRSGEVIRNLLLLRELSEEMNFKLMVNTVIQPGKVQHARDVLDFANDLGIWFCPVPLNAGPTVDSAIADDPEYRELAELILERKRAGHLISGSLRMNQRLLFSEPLDCRNALKPHIDFDGSLVWPCKAAVAVQPKHISVLDFDNVDDLYAHAASEIDPTKFQERCGATCNWAQNYTTDTYVHGLRNPRKLLSDVAEFLRAS
jgi:MoaA/NifB/PqqE/SkfB family radical SAM enzyme